MLARTGMELADLYVADIDLGSPEYDAGLRTGDRIVEVDDITVTSWSMYRERINTATGAAHRVSWERFGKRQSGTFPTTAGALPKRQRSGADTAHAGGAQLGAERAGTIGRPPFPVSLCIAHRVGRNA